MTPRGSSAKAEEKTEEKKGKEKKGQKKTRSSQKKEKQKNTKQEFLIPPLLSPFETRRAKKRQAVDRRGERARYAWKIFHDERRRDRVLTAYAETGDGIRALR